MTDPVVSKAVNHQKPGFIARFERFQSTIFEAAREKRPWIPVEYIGLLVLILLCIGEMWSTWANWGNLTIDCGREMYVPRVLAEGKVLYRDVWYLYGPAAPYFNALLFRIFGVHLTVLYIAGSLAAFGSALFLYISGIELGFPLAGWCTGAVVIVQAFVPTMFCFPVPYSFAAVYGCLVACVFLWLAIRECRSPNEGRLFCIGLLASVAMLLKLEFGAACYGALALMIILKQLRQVDRKVLFRGLAAITPGIVLCLSVITWMLTLRDVDFIINENFMSWPTSFFMKTYGKKWLEHTGFALNDTYLIHMLITTMSCLAMTFAVYMALDGKRPNRNILILGALPLAASAIMLPGFFHNASRIAALCPPAMTLYVAVITLILFIRMTRKVSQRMDYALIIAGAFSSLLAFRMLLNLHLKEYAIYYDGPIILCYLVLISLILRTVNRTPLVATRAERFICFAFLGAVFLVSRHLARESVEFQTDYGVIRVQKDLFQGYRTAVAFMKEKAAKHEMTLSIPEDTSLYFLSGTQCPTRVFEFTPGVVAPGRMTEEFVNALERTRPRYLLWSNRKYPEYSAPEFGVDFDKTLGNYFRSHYEELRSVGPFGAPGDWQAVVWERKPERQAK